MGLIGRVETSAVLRAVSRYSNAVPARRGIIEGRTRARLKHLKRKENATGINSGFGSPQKSAIPDETIKRNSINMLAHRFKSLILLEVIVDEAQHESGQK